jgi:hypothetical protein
MDIIVFGIAPGTHTVEDIHVDVPSGQEVTIPGETAYKSKDLWRAINQKQLFLIRAVPNAPPVQVPVSAAVEQELREQVVRLEAENQQLRVELHQQQAESQKSMLETQKMMTAQQERLDALLKMLSSGAIYTQGVAPKAVGADDTVIDGSAPAFIPESITPKTTETRIDTKTEQSESTGVSGAAGRLREMRQRPKQ